MNETLKLGLPRVGTYIVSGRRQHTNDAPKSTVVEGTEPVKDANVHP